VAKETESQMKPRAEVGGLISKTNAYVSPMNHISSEPESQSVALGRAVRFGFAAVALGMSYPNICLALRISAFRAIFKDLLGNKPLPSITTLVLHAQPFLIGLSIVIPLVAIALIFIGRLTHSIYVSGVLVLAVLFQLFFTWHAISAPLFTIFQSMSGSQ
jgi:hypothetical protein